MAEKQVLRVGIFQAADDVPVVRIAFHLQVVLAHPPLPTTVEHRHTETLGNIGELVHPIATVMCVAVENANSGSRSFQTARAKILGVNARPTHAGEPEVKALGVAERERVVGTELHLGILRVKFAQRFVPVSVKVGRAGSDPHVFAEDVTDSLTTDCAGFSN